MGKSTQLLNQLADVLGIRDWIAEIGGVDVYRQLRTQDGFRIYGESDGWSYSCPYVDWDGTRDCPSADSAPQVDF